MEETGHEDLVHVLDRWLSMPNLLALLLDYVTDQQVVISGVFPVGVIQCSQSCPSHQAYIRDNLLIVCTGGRLPIYVPDHYLASVVLVGHHCVLLVCFHDLGHSVGLRSRVK